MSIPSWVAQSVFYQIFPERFCNGDPANDPPGSASWGAAPELFNHFGGDLKGIIDRLPYLQDLGINALYLTPIFMAPSNHKYDTADYLKIDPAFGDLALCKELVRSAHSGGIRVVMDAVFNHCGEEFWAFKDLKQRGVESKYRDWFLVQDYPICKEPASYQTCGGAAFLPKLNVENPDVKAYLLSTARYWLEETGMDGWRLDVPWKVPLDFWREFYSTVKAINPQAYVVAEAWRDPAPWINGDTSDGIMNYPLRDYILEFCVFDRMDAEDFFYFVTRLLDLYGDAAPYQLNFLGCHDTPRLLTLCNGDRQRMILAATAAFTLPGAPMIYYGDEIGLEGENDPDCRRCMPWQEGEWDHNLRVAYQKLVALRKTPPALQIGKLDKCITFNGLLVYGRNAGDDNVLVALNPREARKAVKIPLSTIHKGNGGWQDQLTGKIYAQNGDTLFIDDIAAKTAMILIPAL